MERLFDIAVSAIMASFRNTLIWPNEDERLRAGSQLAEKILWYVRRGSSSGSGGGEPVGPGGAHVEPLNQIEVAILTNFNIVRDLPMAQRLRVMDDIEWFWAQTKRQAFRVVRVAERAEHDARVSNWAISVSVEKRVK